MIYRGLKSLATKQFEDYIDLQEVILSSLAGKVTSCCELYQRGITMSQEYLTTEERALRVKYDARTIRERMKDSVLLDGIHYVRSFGGRKILYLWEAVERDTLKCSRWDGLTLPTVNRRVCHGYVRVRPQNGRRVTPIASASSVKVVWPPVADFRSAKRALIRMTTETNAVRSIPYSTHMTFHRIDR